MIVIVSHHLVHDATWNISEDMGFMEGMVAKHTHRGPFLAHRLSAQTDNVKREGPSRQGAPLVLTRRDLSGTGGCLEIKFLR